MDLTPTSSAVLVLEDVTKTYRSRAGNVNALLGVSHEFASGSFTSVMGPSGSGKSTLLQCAAGLDRPTRGSVVLAGSRLEQLDESALTLLRRREMAFVFQAYNLLTSLTAFDNVALPLRLQGVRPGRREVLDALAAVGLEDKARHRPAELSGGQQQRVALARALICRPSVLFADEPTGALDTTAGRQVLALLRNLTVQSGQTVVMVTHDPAAAAYADDVIFLQDGRVVRSLRQGDAELIAATMGELER
jgi:putative ABC transport system ATP-binding protein